MWRYPFGSGGNRVTTSRTFPAARSASTISSRKFPGCSACSLTPRILTRYARDVKRTAVLVACLTVIPLGAAAQRTRPAAPPVSENVARGRALYAEGLAALEEARWADALGAFRESYALSEAPPALFNVALVLRALGRLREARDALTALIALDGVDPTLRETAVMMRREAAVRIAQLTLDRLPAASEALRLRLDGAPLDDARERPLRLEIDPGEHTLAVAYPGHELFEWRRVVRDGDRINVQIVLRDESTPIWPWLALAGGIAVVA